jgi:hypothetical protein
MACGRCHQPGERRTRALCAWSPQRQRGSRRCQHSRARAQRTMPCPQVGSIMINLGTVSWSILDRRHACLVATCGSCPMQHLQWVCAERRHPRGHKLTTCLWRCGSAERDEDGPQQAGPAHGSH